MAINVFVTTTQVFLQPGAVQSFIVNATVGRQIVSAGFHDVADRKIHLWRRPLSPDQWEIRLDGTAVTSPIPIMLWLVEVN